VTEWGIRAAQRSDRRILSRFSCAMSTDAWAVEVETIIRTRILDWAFKPDPRVVDPRLLLVFARTKGELVAVAAHQTADLVGGDGRDIPASRLYVVALATDWQGRRFGSGERASDVVMSAAIVDVDARAPPRNQRIYAVVHKENVRSIAVCQRNGFTKELSSPDPEYRRLITEQR
jgi:hypothetical protein